MKRKILLIVILIVITLLSSCSDIQLAMMQGLEEDDVKEDVENVINAIQAENSDYIFDTYFSKFDEIDEDEFYNDIKKIYSIYEGSYISSQLYNISVNSFTNNNETKTIKTVIYLIRTDENAYTLKLQYLKNSDAEYDLYRLDISPYLNYVVNYRFKDYDLKTWIYFIINIVSYGIMILAMILCIKTKIKLKPLWIILILLQVGISVTDFSNYHSSQFGFFSILAMSQYVVYAHGGTITNFYIHIFAIVFLFIRKKLNRNYIAQQKFLEEKKEKEEQLRMEHEAKQAEQINIEAETDKNQNENKI